jgi:flagellar protein FlbT
MPLKLSLKPGEKFVLNGAVVENGDRRATLILQNKASVLREKDIMQEHEADTPAKRIYLPVMMMYLSASSQDGLYDEFVMRMTEFMGAISSADAMSDCVAVSREVMSGEYYKALLRCRKLIAFEAERLGGEAAKKAGSEG